MRVPEGITHHDGTAVRSPRRRRLRRALFTLLTLVLVVALGLGGFAVYLNSKVGNVTVDDSLLPADDEAGGAGEAPGPSGEGSSDGTGEEDGGEPDRDLVRGAGENYLIIGSDAQPGEAGSRSDVIVLAHVTEANDKVYLIHFPRDLYVEIPGRGKDKINAAFAYGGGALLARTVQNLVGVEIDHAAKIDFTGFERMTDAVGGVRVYAEEASTHYDFTINQGWNDLTGAQALDFVRERKQLSEGDISRGRRQMAFIKALMVKTLSPSVLLNPVRLTRFVDAATDNLVVDAGMTADFMRGRAFDLRDLRGDDIVFVTAPFKGYGVAPNGGAIDILDEPGMERLAFALQDDDVERFLADADDE